MVPGISLANKCQIVFGGAVVVILASALAVPWVRTRLLIDDYQIEVARQITDAWLTDRIQLGMLEPIGSRSATMRPSADDDGSLSLAFVWSAELDDAADDDPFIAHAAERFRTDAEATEHAATIAVDGHPVYRYARAIRASELLSIRDWSISRFDVSIADLESADPLRAILVVDRTSEFAAGQLLRSQIFIISAGIAGSLLAILVFYLILKTLILSPVRRLRATAEKVEAGDLEIRSEIRTGDEFEQLAEAFNLMLDRVGQSQAQLKTINESLDLKVDELAEANVGLFESNRLKSEFLANVSHELRTPLNSVIGFAELLSELARSDERADPKRTRYLENILTSGRSLLEMINELLDMAKIEAGRMEVAIESTSVTDLVEGLVRILRPQAETKGLDLRLEFGSSVPAVETDPGKLQQILYNFLSNAIKFTPVDGMITISADRVTRQDNAAGVRLAVADSGPGIPADMQDAIFEKFRQVDASHTREHPGTGLGLAICRELAEMLGASVSFVSEEGRGATFFVDLPIHFQVAEERPLMG